MIAASFTAGDLPALILSASGAIVLAVIVRRHRAGRPLLRTVPEPFRRTHPTPLLLSALGLFAVYALSVGRMTVPPEPRRFAPAISDGTLGYVLGASIPLGTAALALLFARTVVLRPRDGVIRRVGIGLLVLWASLPLVYGTYLVCQWIGEEQVQIDLLRKRADGWPWLVVAACLVAPVVEEACFRGLVYPALRQRMSVRGAILCSSLAFALVHPPTVWLPLAILAAALAWLVETTGSVVPSIAAHMAFNAITVGTLLLIPA